MIKSKVMIISCYLKEKFMLELIKLFEGATVTSASSTTASTTVAATGGSN